MVHVRCRSWRSPSPVFFGLSLQCRRVLGLNAPRWASLRTDRKKNSLRQHSASSSGRRRYIRADSIYRYRRASDEKTFYYKRACGADVIVNPWMRWRSARGFPRTRHLRSVNRTRSDVINGNRQTRRNPTSDKQPALKWRPYVCGDGAASVLILLRPRCLANSALIREYRATCTGDTAVLYSQPVNELHPAPALRARRQLILTQPRLAH
jgi:hypothetical protein